MMLLLCTLHDISHLLSQTVLLHTVVILHCCAVAAHCTQKQCQHQQLY
jgi:hypothetical protein